MQFRPSFILEVYSQRAKEPEGLLSWVILVSLQSDTSNTFKVQLLIRVFSFLTSQPLPESGTDFLIELLEVLFP